MSDADPNQTLIAVDFHGNTHEVKARDLTWRPSVYAVVIHDDKVLLTRQLATYNLPGGGMEYGETPEEAVVREVEEETGVKTANPRLLDCKSNIFKDPGSGEIIQSVLLFYACDFVSGGLSIKGLDQYEQTWTEMPEWVSVDRLDSIKRGSSYEWGDVVKRAAVLADKS